MDIQMPALDGVEATRRVRAAGAGRVVILTTYDYENYVFEAIKAGASGYLLKDAPADLLTDAIRRVARGEPFVQPSLASKVLLELTREGPHALTARETEVLRLLARGAANKEIARELALTEGTVKNHVTSILEKLHARNRTEAANAARERGLL
jgi:DNA-binding NarL/FixJ family response regulator